MKAKEYYKSTRMVETRDWTLEMVFNFAEEYAEALRKHAVSGSLPTDCIHYNLAKQDACAENNVCERCRQ